MKVFIIFFLIVETVLSIETTILQYLTKTDQQSLIVAKELFNVIQSQRYFQKQPFTCLTLLPSNLTKNHKQKVFKLNLTYNYNHHETHTSQPVINSTVLQKNTNQETNQIIDIYEDYDYNKILDLLHGTCAIHETNEFLYEYCHKQKVRQFDNVYTLQRMAKSSYEDISLGEFNYQEALKKSKSDQDKSLKPNDGIYKIKYSQNGDLTVLNTLFDNFPELSQADKILLKKTINQNLKSTKTSSDTNKDGKTAQPQIIVQTIPIRSTIYDKKNLFTVDYVNHEEYELNKQDKVIHLNYPIVKGNKYFSKVQYTHQVTCEYNNEGKSIYISKAIVISSFQLAFLGNVSKCDKIIEISAKPLEEKPYDSPFWIDKFREVDDFLFGYVDQFCTNNWDWNMNAHNDFLKERNNNLEPGNTLWLQFVTNVSGKLTYGYQGVTVKKIIAPGVIKTYQNVQQKLVEFRNKMTNNSKDSFWINSCRIVSQNPIDNKSLNAQNQIIRKNIIKIKQLSTQKLKQSGDEMLCLCDFKKYSQQFLQMHLTLGTKILQANQQNNWYSYFEFYQKKTVKTTNQNQQHPFHEICGSIICFDVNKLQNLHSQSKPINSQTSSNYFTQIQKITSNKPVLTDNLQTDNSIFIIDISENGILKIHTEVDGQKYFYLISTSMLFKIRLFSNGTKQIIKENSFYQNQTTYNYLSWFGNSIFIHKKFIWRGNDKVVFPRMDMGNQQITQIQRISGYAYLRKLDLTKMKHKDSHYISSIRDQIQNHFRLYKYPLFAKNQHQQTKIQNKAQLITTQKTAELTEEKSSINEQNLASVQQGTQIIQKQDFSKVDFNKYEYKPLNKSVSVRYQYFHGDFCGAPINKHRRTNVDLQCGEPWLKIQQVKQVSPCIYEMKVSTRLLCRQSYNKVVQKFTSLKKSFDNRVNLQKGLICYPEEAWDNALYVYDVANKDVLLQIK